MNAAHLHLILNHIPILGSYATLLLIALAVSQKSQAFAKLTLQLMVLWGILALTTYFTGQSAEDVVEHLPGVEESFIERHEDLALYGLIVTELLAVIGLVGLFKPKGIEAVLTKYWKPIAILAFVNASLMAITAITGGEIRHTEIRKGNSIVSPP